MVLPACALLRTLSILYPASHGEIGGFSTIETMIESRMVSKRKCDHNFVRLLRYLMCEEQGIRKGNCSNYREQPKALSNQPCYTVYHAASISAD